MKDASPLGLLSFLSFAFSVIAAVLAIDMYKLLRTGEFGKTWRLLIIASVMFALLQMLRMAEILNWRAIDVSHLAQVVELVFVISLAYAFYLQRSAFTHEHKKAKDTFDEDEKVEALPAEDEDVPYLLAAEMEDDLDEDDGSGGQWPSVSSLEARRTIGH